MTEGSPLSEKEQRRRSAAELFLKVHDLTLDNTELSQPPVARLCTLMLSEALLSKSDQLRVRAPSAGGAQIQFHRDGAWQDVMRVPAPVQAPIVNRFKVMANLDVAKQPLQEGTLKVQLHGEVVTLAITVRLRGDSEEAILDLPPRPPDDSVAS